MSKSTAHKTKITLIVNILILIILGTGLFFAHHFIDQTRQSVGRMVNQAKQSEDRSVIITVNRVLDELREYNISLDEFFVDKDDAVGFVEQIESMGRDAGVALDIKKLTLNENSVRGSFGEILLQLKVSGSWPSVMNFVMLIENMPKSISIRDLSMTGSRSRNNAEQQNQITWTAEMNIKTIVK